MASTYTSNKRYEKQGTGDNVGTWGPFLNANFDLIDQNFGGTLSLALTNIDVNISQPQQENVRQLLTGVLSGNVNLILANGYSGSFIIDNRTTGSFSVNILTDAVGSTGVNCAQGFRTFVFCDGTHVVYANNAPGSATAAATSLTPTGYVTATDLQAAIAQIASRNPVGTIIDAAGTTAPAGSLACDGSAVSRVTYASLFAYLVTAPGYAATTCTFGFIGSPTIINKTAHGFVGGERLRFSTSGSLPTGMNTSTDYFVEVIDANSFWLQTSQATTGSGTRLVTSGAASGVTQYTQSLWGLGDGSTTFNVPDLRGVFSRGKDGGRGLSLVDYQVGVRLADAFAAHTHTGTTNTDGAHTHDVKYNSRTDVATTGGGTAVQNISAGGSSTGANAAISSGSTHSHAFTTDSTGTGAETVPKHAILLKCIVY
jgi:microcystin-dependent protein